MRDVQVIGLPTPSETTVPESEREPRVLLAARVEVPGAELRVLTADFGLGVSQRVDQARALLAHLAEMPEGAWPAITSSFAIWSRRTGSGSCEPKMLPRIASRYWPS